MSIEGESVDGPNRGCAQARQWIVPLVRAVGRSRMQAEQRLEAYCASATHPSCISPALLHGRDRRFPLGKRDECRKVGGQRIPDPVELLGPVRSALALDVGKKF